VLDDGVVRRGHLGAHGLPRGVRQQHLPARRRVSQRTRQLHLGPAEHHVLGQRVHLQEPMQKSARARWPLNESQTPTSYKPVAELIDPRSLNA
jgi:hypothetical protein